MTLSHKGSKDFYPSQETYLYGSASDDSCDAHDYDNSCTADSIPSCVRKERIGTWIIAILFAVVFLGGIAFYAVELGVFSNLAEQEEQVQNVQTPPQQPTDNSVNVEEFNPESPKPSNVENLQGSGGLIGGALAEGSTQQGETNAQSNAFMSAKLHIAEMPYSRGGMIKLLMNEGFTREDAEYAADKLNTDWQQEAVRMARQYVDTMPFSREDLLDQLQYEGFSLAQAEAAATAVGL